MTAQPMARTGSVPPQRRDPDGPAISVRGLTRVYEVPGRRDARVVALDGVSADLPAGSFTAVVGASGSGKSTLLHIRAGLDEPTDGRVSLLGTTITSLTPAKRADFRSRNVGFVFQDYSLIDALTVSENMALPARISRRVVAEDHLREVAEGLGIDSLLGRRTSELSGGQRQRVAIGRAVVNNARVLFADEPTGALDPVTRQEVLSVLLDPAVREERAVLIATHDVTLASSADRVLVIDGGGVAAVLEKPTPDGVLDALKETGDAV